MSEPRSRVFRQVVTQEIVVMVPADGEVTIDGGVLRVAHEGLTDGFDGQAVIAEAIQSADCGRWCWITAGETQLGPIEELTP